MNGSQMLREWRERKDLKVNAAARLLGVGWKEIKLWEDPTSGRRPGLDAAVRIQRECGIAPEAWVSEPTKAA